MLSANPDFEIIKASFPMFGVNIAELWGTRGFKTFINELLYDAKGGARGGFPEPVLQALRRLSDLHDVEFSALLPPITGTDDFKLLNASFPRIADQISAIWGTAQFNPYLKGLLHDNRGGNRHGFPFETLMALHAMAEKHNQEFAHLYSQLDIWNAS